LHLAPQVALDYSAIVLQLRQNRWGAPSPTPDNGSSTTASEDPPGPLSLLSALTEQSRFVNMLEEEEDWLPVTLEFFLQASAIGRVGGLAP
jgi:hypothetical protein